MAKLTKGHHATLSESSVSAHGGGVSAVPAALRPKSPSLGKLHATTYKPVDVLHESSHEFGEKTRLLNRIEAAFKRFHHKYTAEEWESADLATLRTATTKAEAIAEIIELETLRASEYAGTAPFYTSAPSMAVDADDIATLDAKVHALTTLYRLANNPKVLKLRPQAYALSVDNSDVDTLSLCVRKAQMLRDIKTYQRNIRLSAGEDAFDLTSPLSDIETLHSAMVEDLRLLKTFAKCPMCKLRHAPQYVLDKHPHLKLKPTGTTHFGGKSCCVACAPYWD